MPGDWALPRLGAVYVENAENVTLMRCNFTRLDGNAVMISGYNRHTHVTHNHFSWLGGNAVASWGYTNDTGTTNETNFGYDGTDGNFPWYNDISYNLMREVGHFQKQSSFYFQAKSAESRVAYNVMFNDPRAAICLNDGFGGGDVLQGNVIFNMVRETLSHGPFNSWDRQVWEWMDDSSGVPTKSIIKKYDEIKGNFFVSALAS